MRESRLATFLDFTFDLASGDLRRGNVRLRVPQQTSRLLAILVERAGTVVTREELQQLLWPDGEFLDHEHAINRVITDLRAVLRDNPQKPRCIETVRKRGYRFLPPVAIASSIVPPLVVTGNAAKALPSPNLSAAIVPSSAQSIDSPLGPIQPVERLVVGSQARARSVRRPLVWAGLCGAAVLIPLVAVLGFRHLRGQPPVQTRVIALGIAPFQSDGPGAEQMGESFRLDLADALSQLPAVQIRATNSLGSVGRDDNSIRSVADKLHLDMLLFGRIRVQDERCIAQFELVRTRDSLHLASFQYEGGQDELAVMRDKLQRDLFVRLQSKSTSVQAIRGSTENPQAYSEYLKARELTQIRDPKSLNEALAHYEKAVRLDPDFAQAYSGMATAHIALRYFDPADHQEKAQKLAENALQLDPYLAEAHGVLGDVAFRSAWNFALGESELRRAVESEPQRAIYHAWLAGLLADEGRGDEAQVEIDHAIADDPLWPSVYSMAAFVAGANRDNVRLLAAVQKYLSLVPDSAYTHDQLAWAYFSMQRYEDALSEWKKMAEMEKDSARIALEERGRLAFRDGGIQSYARVRLGAIERHTVETARHPNDFVPAEWYAFVGENDKALGALQHLVASHDGEAVQLAVNPMFDNLHNDPRFIALLQQVGLNLPSDRDHSAHPGP
jgi:DNA-binding winged helix-turn-helix (wHTH) protein/tetratricopeptide (TPR) repeat protein